MTAIAWTVVGLAVCIQLLNVIVVLTGYKHGERRSQIPLVPVILWYVALVIHGDSFFFASEPVELAIVFLSHLLITAVLALVNYVGRPRT